MINTLMGLPPVVVGLLVYLMLSSTFRFGIEFFRLNPRLLWGLSEAQLIAMGLTVLGLCGFLYLSGKQNQHPVTAS